MVDATSVRTPYLENARLLRRHRGGNPDMAAVDALEATLGAGSTTVGGAVRILFARGMSERAAREGIAVGVAWNLLPCDLSTPFGDATEIRCLASGNDWRREPEPVLRLLAASSR